MRYETIDVGLFLGSTDPTSLETDKLQSNLQELVSSEDRCCITFILVISILHDDLLMKCSSLVVVVALVDVDVDDVGD